MCATLRRPPQRAAQPSQQHATGNAARGAAVALLRTGLWRVSPGVRLCGWGQATRVRKAGAIKQAKHTPAIRHATCCCVGTPADRSFHARMSYFSVSLLADAHRLRAAAEGEAQLDPALVRMQPGMATCNRDALFHNAHSVSDACLVP
jgi:hypothetical protein